MKHSAKQIGVLALVILGAVLLIKFLLPLRVPLAILAMLALLVWAGVYARSGRPLSLGFGEGALEPIGGDAPAHLCMLGSQTLDLTNTDTLPPGVKVTAVLGTVTVRLPVDACARVQARALLGLVEPPDGKMLFLGREAVSCGAQAADAPVVRLDADSILGRVKLILG